jgi:hypothetical protein
MEEQINCVTDPVEGLKKRPPTEHIKKIISGTLASRPSLFKIDRDPDNQYIGMIEGGRVRVFDINTGVEKTVTGGTNAYLTSATPHKSMRMLSVADYTFIANRETVVGRTSAASTARPFEGLIFVRGANYGKTYTIRHIHKVGSLVGTASFTTPRGDAASHIDTTNTTYIATRLAAALAASPYGPETVEQIGSVIYVSDPSADFTMELEDAQGGEAMKGFKDNIQRFSDLPAKAKEGLVLRIAGDQTSAFDDYWVQYVNGVWQETVQPQSLTSLDPATMPHALIRNPDGSFRLEALPWVDRAVGDDDSCPFPSFLGQKISSMFYFRNRLGFLADENVILSQAGDYFNFFRTTATQLLPGDPIDTPASDASGESSPVSILEHAVAFDKKLVIFARNAQFIMGSSGTLTPAEAEIDPVTSFACSPDCRPVALGRYIYFAFDRDGASGLREFYVDGAAQTEDAQEVTAHCPTFLPTGILSMSGSTLENVLVALPETNANKVYVYEYFWGNNEKLQSAWGSWEFPATDEVLFFDFIENVGFMVFRRADGYHLEKVRFRPGLVDEALDYFTCLDHRVDSTQYTSAYNPVPQTTTLTLPYDAPAGISVATGFSSGLLHAPGVTVPVVSQTGNTVTVAGNVTAWNLVIGVPYTQRFTFTRPYLMQGSANGGTVANTEAILKVKDYAIDFEGAGYFKAIFSPSYRTPVIKEFSGRILGATAASVPPLEEGTFRIKTPTKNTLWSLSIENSSIFPSSFLSASWRGIVESKATRA